MRLLRRLTSDVKKPKNQGLNGDEKSDLFSQLRFQYWLGPSYIPAYRLYRTVPSIFSLALACFSPRVARPRPPFETRARVSPAKLALGRIGIFRTVSRASSKGLASSRAASSTRTRFNTRDARGVTCDTDRPLAR